MPDNNTHRVYFIQSEKNGAIKIGYTANDPKKRLASMQTGNPTKLYLLGSIPGGRDREAEIHAALQEYRLLGEWFDGCAYVADYVQSLVAEDGTRWIELCEDRQSEIMKGTIIQNQTQYRAYNSLLANAKPGNFIEKTITALAVESKISFRPFREAMSALYDQDIWARCPEEGRKSVIMLSPWMGIVPCSEPDRVLAQRYLDWRSAAKPSAHLIKQRRNERD